MFRDLQAFGGTIPRLGLPSGLFVIQEGIQHVFQESHHSNISGATTISPMGNHATPKF
jgi:hypothetical protein